MISEIKLQKKREKKATRRRYVRYVKKRLMCQLGTYLGHDAYRKWRDGVMEQKKKRRKKRGYKTAEAE